MIDVAAMLAGGLGAVARFVVDGELRARVRSRLPVGTMVINLLGSFVLGLLWGAAQHGQIAAPVFAIVGTGFCGGFTTFSTASLDAVRLLQRRRPAAATIVVGGVAVTCVALAWLGSVIG